MAVLSWGKPTVEFKSSSASEWTAFPEIVEDTAALETTEGELIEATEEGGGVVDARRKRNKYKFSLELFVKKGDTRPITDEDGVIADNYSIRLTPEDEACEGFLLDKCNVTVSETWNAANGKRLRYTFDAIKPATGAICKPYTKGVSE
jgi:hypothetical protein